MKRTVRLPSWSQYQLLSDDQRQRMYLQWCQSRALDPDAEGSGYAFVESIPINGHEAVGEEFEIPGESDDHDNTDPQQ